jgi:hypothetical protein
MAPDCWGKPRLLQSPVLTTPPDAIPLAFLFGFEERLAVHCHALACMVRAPMREVTLISVISAHSAYEANCFA